MHETRRDLEIVLGPPMPVSFRRSAGCPPVEFNSRVWTESQVERTQEAGCGTTTRSAGSTSTDTPLIISLDSISLVPEFFFETVKLLHEVEIGGNVCFSAAHQIEGVVETESALVHEVSDGNRDGSGDTSQAVDQDSFV